MAEQLAFDLPGVEVGKREERTEWGVRSLVDGLHPRGHVEPRPGERSARWVEEDEAARLMYGWPERVEVVRRTVVTYTSPWQAGGES